MIVNRNHFIAPREREALISLTAIGYIEEHELLSRAQLDDAKRSLQALFLRASGEETMLRKLIEVLKVTRHIHHSFASISGTIAGVSKGARVVADKFASLGTQITNTAITAEAHAAFVGRFLSFSQRFIRLITAFTENLSEYLTAREQMARAQSVYVIAREARERLRQRLAGRMGQASAAIEPDISKQVVSSFDYGEAEVAFDESRHEAQMAQREVHERLRDIQTMCCLATEPALRDRLAIVNKDDDIYARFVDALPRHACLRAIQEPVKDLLKLYHHSHGMFQQDYQKLNRALDALLDNADAYFDAKREDRDLTTKRDKLRKIEGLIPFLEQATHLATDDAMDAYATFSRQLSAQISERRAPWSHIAEDLLRAKVQAEAEMSVRL